MDVKSNSVLCLYVCVIERERGGRRREREREKRKRERDGETERWRERSNVRIGDIKDTCNDEKSGC